MMSMRRSLSRIVVHSLLAPILACRVQGAAEAQPSAYVLGGLSFSPYIDADEDPSRSGSQITPEELEDRLAIVTPHTQWIRTFGCNADLREAGALAHSYGVQAAIGAWLARDPIENQKQIDCLIEEALEGNVDTAVVGSEVLLRGDLSEAQLIAHIEQVKQALQAANLEIPVTTGEVYGILLAHPTVIAAVDVVFANYYPYWEGRPVELAVAYVHRWHQDLVAAAGGKEVVVSETGWPSCGNQLGQAIPSAENAAYYFLNFVSWARANNVQYLYFETFDEPWKARFEGPQGACWGVWDRTGVLKDGMAAVLDDKTLPDNWSQPLPDEPLIDFRGLPTITETNISSFLVTGFADPAHFVLLNGSPLPADAIDSGGSFALASTLAPGTNDLLLRVETAAGVEVWSATKTVIYDPNFSTLSRRLVYVDVVNVDSDVPTLSGTIVIDLDHNNILGILEDQHVRGISPDGNEIYLADNTVLDTAFHQVSRTLPFTQTLLSEGFFVSPDGSRLYARAEIADVTTSQLLPVGPDAESILMTGSWASAPVPGDPTMPLASDVIYCCNDMKELDGTTLAELRRRGTLSDIETDITITPDESAVLLASYSFSTGRVRVYSRDDLSSLIATVSGLGDFVGEMGFSTEGHRLIVGSAGRPDIPSDGRVSVIDLDTWQILFQVNIPLSDNLVVSERNEVIVSSGENDILRRIGVQVLVLEPGDSLVRSKTFFLGVHRHIQTTGKPKNDRIRKLVLKPVVESHPLTVNKVGTGDGRVTSEPPGIDCGSTCSESYDLGTIVALTAIANAGSRFEGWSGGCTPDGLVMMRRDRSCEATFTTITSDRIGVYRPSNRLFLLDVNGSGNWTPPADTAFLFGESGDLPIIGDWNGDGDDDIGVYRPSDRRFLLDSDENGAWNPPADAEFQFGVIDDVPIIGDWNGDGDDDIGVYRPSSRLFLLDLDESGTWSPATDQAFLMGLIGDIPIIGDWNGDGDDNIGIYRPSNRVFLLDYDEGGTWTPATDRGYLMGLIGDTPLIGDWNDDGDDNIGVHRPSNRVFVLDYDEGGTWTPATDLGYSFGLDGDKPLAGNW